MTKRPCLDETAAVVDECAITKDGDYIERIAELQAQYDGKQRENHKKVRQLVGLVEDLQQTGQQLLLERCFERHLYQAGVRIKNLKGGHMNLVDTTTAAFRSAVSLFESMHGTFRQWPISLTTHCVQLFGVALKDLTAEEYFTIHDGMVAAYAGADFHHLVNCKLTSTRTADERDDDALALEVNTRAAFLQPLEKD